METIATKLRKYQSATPSHWRAEAERRCENRSWLRYSQRIAMKMLDRMEQLGITQRDLAEKMDCSQQYVSKLLKGRENLSLETIAKIEEALSLQLMQDLS